MARPKERTNTAFQQKCQAASDKLIQFQARTLRDDIERLYTDEVLTDVSVDIGCRKLSLHRCIVKARSEDLYNYITSLPGNSSSDVSLVTKSASTDIEQYIRSLYTDDDVTEALVKLEDYIEDEAGEEVEESKPDTYRPDRPESDTDRRQGVVSGEDLHVISENITNTSLDLVKCEVKNRAKKEQHCCTDGETGSQKCCSQTGTGSVCNRNGYCNSDNCHLEEVYRCSECDDNFSDSGTGRCLEFGSDEDIYKLAQTIVEKVIREAQVVVGCVKVDGSDKINRLDEGSKETKESVIKDGNKICDTTALNGTASSSEIIPKKSSSGICTAEKPKVGKNNCRFKPSRNSTETVQGLLQRVYRVKTLMKPCSLLGEDLVRMLLTKSCADCVISVDGDSYPAHRCVLAARSSYFAAMLGGYWRESEEQHIVLEGIDGQVLKQTLLYLYGGVVEVDPSCALGGLVMMADMYGMEGLKEVVAYNLNVQYCHFFHRPCPECIAGVPEALALTMMYNMDAMKEKCVRWINKNFVKVWPSKSLATLPQEVLEFCVSSAVKDLALNNVLDIMVDCQRLNEKTPRLKWTEPIFDMITQLIDAAIEFASQNFINLLSGNTFRKIDKEGISFNKQPLEDIFSMIIQALSPENACLAYLSLNKWIKTIEAQLEEELSLFSEEFVDFVNVLFKKCREHLCLYIHQAANTAQWDLLTKDMQENIMQEANYVCIDTNRGRMARPKLSSMQKKISATSPLSLKEYFECHFGQSKPPTRNVKSRKDQQKDTKKGKQPETKESSKKTVGKFSSKSAEPSSKPPVTLNKKSKLVLETPGKHLKVTGPGKTVSQGKSIPVSKEVKQYVTKMKYELRRDKKLETGFGSHVIDNIVEGDNLASAGEAVEVDNLASAGEAVDVDKLASAGTTDENCYDSYYYDSYNNLSKLVANTELVELAEGVNYQEENLVPFLSVNFLMPE